MIGILIYDYLVYSESIMYINNVYKELDTNI